MGFSTTALTLVTLTVLFTVIQSEESIRMKRRLYAMCPPKFQRIGSECYAISDQPANWLEAHFQCKDKNSKLAEPNAKSDRKLRAFFQRMDHDTDEIWIGATYDWHINTWQWSISGKNLTYDAFSRIDPQSRQTLEYHCAALNPSLQYRWSARSCVDKHRYICQHKMPKVSDKNRFKVYNRWNQTYPNQLANEVELEVIDTKSKDGKRSNRRIKPVDSGENYAMPPKRSPTTNAKQRRRPHVPPKEINNDINVRFIPNYLTNDINEGVSYKTPSPATINPLTIDFIPADMPLDNINAQPAQAYMDTTTKRPRNPTNAPLSDNETVTSTKPRTKPSGKRVRTKFDEEVEEKRRIEKQRKRAEHRRHRQEHLRKKQEEKKRKQEEDRKKQEEERKKQEEERKQEEAERKKQELAIIEQLKQKQAEEEKLLKQQEEAALLERQKIEAQQELSRKEQELKEKEEKILQEKRDEEEEHIRKDLLHEENRLKLEFEERLKEKETERERRLEEENRLAEENRRRAEQAEKARQEEMKRLQQEEEKRLELERLEIERKRQEKELASLEEENRKRLAAQKLREEEIRRREEALASELAKEKLLEEELRLEEEKNRLKHEEEIQRDIEEKKKKEEAERLENERKEELRRKKAEINKAKLEKEAKLQLEKQKEALRKYAERISRLPPEQQKSFMELRRARKRNKKQHNEASIPEQK